MRKLLLLAAVASAFVAVVAVAAPIASADYGNTAQYQAAISLNCDNKGSLFCTQMVGLGGEWEWFAFSNDRTYDATMTFCSHDPTSGIGAFHMNDSGQWQPGPAGPTAPPFGQTQDFWINDGSGWQDSGVPYLPLKSMHYSIKGGPGISAEAQVSYIPNR
jgi:hypothetical protein